MNNEITLIPNIQHTDNTRKCWFHEFLRKSSTLVITAGDSWTWGDSLGTINPEDNLFDDYNHRTEHVYGRLLADKLNADFLNIAKCGGWNSEIFDNLILALKHINTKYEKIYVFVTLTELGREIWGDPLWIGDDFLNIDTIDEFLKKYEENMFTSFKQLIGTYPNINFKIARNFTYSYQGNINILNKYHIEKTWVDCLNLAQDNSNEYPDDIRIMSGICMVPLHKRLKKLGIFKRFKYQFIEYYATADLAIDWLNESSLNYKKATKHPTEEGHQIWADYLFSRINVI